jgi:hypothetical protein
MSGKKLLVGPASLLFGMALMAGTMSYSMRAADILLVSLGVMWVILAIKNNLSARY